MTIRDLLTHTSGLTYGIFGNTVVDTMYRKANLWAGTLKEMIQKLSQIPLLYQPGTQSLGSEGVFGWSGIYNTFFSVDPEEKLIWILMTQFSPHSYYPIHREFNVLVYQAIVD